MSEYDYLFKSAEDDYNRSSYEYAASGFSKIAGGYINYGALKADAAQLQTEAKSIELQAKERANIIRQQFIEAAGAYQMNAAQRGISVGSMSVRSNLENSAIDMGKDIAKMDRSARLKANALRAQAKIAKIGGKYGMIADAFQGISDLASSFATSGMGGSGTENMSGQGSGWNPKTSAPARKPVR